MIEFVKLSSSSRVANAVVSFEGINVIFGIVRKGGYLLVFPPPNFIFLDEEYKRKVFGYIIDLWREKEK